MTVFSSIVTVTDSYQVLKQLFPDETNIMHRNHNLFLSVKTDYRNFASTKTFIKPYTLIDSSCGLSTLLQF